MLLNPFTSKALPFSPTAWAEGIRQVHRRLQGKVPFEVVVFPGTDATSHEIAAEIRARLEAGDTPVPVRLLTGPDGPLTPVTALAALGREIDRFDLCVTADTFTGHLTPLFRIPTVVVAYSQFRKFWVPSRFSFNCPLEEMESRGLPLIARLLALLAGATRALPARERAVALLAATEGVSAAAAGHGAPAAAALAAIERALAEIFRHLERGFPFYDEVQRWLLLWSRLTWAHGREPASGEALRRYLERWEQSEAYKLLTLGV